MAWKCPADRKRCRQAGKGRRSRCAAYHEGGHIIIEVKDDGQAASTWTAVKAQGDLERACIDRGRTGEDDGSAQIHKFIFAAGFSTAAHVTSVSGRGVGMDVVRNNVELIGGTIDLKFGAGQPRFELHHQDPADARHCLCADRRRLGGDRFAIPQLSVVELVRVQTNSEHRIERIKDTPGPALAQQAAAAGASCPHLLGMSTVKPTPAPRSTQDTGFIVVMQVGSARPSAWWSTVSSTPRKSSSSRCPRCCATSDHVLRQHHSW